MRDRIGEARERVRQMDLGDLRVMLGALTAMAERPGVDHDADLLGRSNRSDWQRRLHRLETMVSTPADERKWRLIATDFERMLGELADSEGYACERCGATSCEVDEDVCGACQALTVEDRESHERDHAWGRV